MTRFLQTAGIVVALASSAIVLGIAASLGPARWGKDGLTLGVAVGTFATIAIVAGFLLAALRTVRGPLARVGVIVGGGVAVVLAHGAGSSRDAVVSHAQVLTEAGYGVLAVDARGHGNSTGRAMDLGWWGEADLAAAMDTLASFDDVDPDRLGLVGLSMGGESAIGAAGADPRARAVVAEGATQRTSADKAGWLPRHPLGWLQRGMDLERDALAAAMTDAPRPTTLRAAAAATNAPLLLIASGDVPDEGMAASWIAEGNARVEVWEIDGASHTGGLEAEPEAWPRLVIGFLDEALMAPAG